MDSSTWSNSHNSIDRKIPWSSFLLSAAGISVSSNDYVWIVGNYLSEQFPWLIFLEVQSWEGSEICCVIEAWILWMKSVENGSWKSMHPDLQNIQTTKTLYRQRRVSKSKRQSSLVRHLLNGRPKNASLPLTWSPNLSNLIKHIHSTTLLGRYRNE
jgi:hypothetical protein